MVRCSTTILHYEPLLASATWISYSVSLQAISLHIHFQLCFALVFFIVSEGFFPGMRVSNDTHVECVHHWNNLLCPYYRPTNQSFSDMMQYGIKKKHLSEKTEAKTLSTSDSSGKQRTDAWFTDRI